MSRRSVISLLAVVGSLALVSAAGIAFRLPLVAWLAERELAGLGIANAELTVEQVGWRETRFTDVSAGESGELRLAQLTAGYRPMRLLTGQLERLTVKGLALRLDLTGDKAALGSLQAPLDALMARPDGGPASDRRLPEITFEASVIEAGTPVGPATLALDGRVEPHADGTLETLLDLSLSGTSGELRARLAAERLADGQVAGNLRIDRGALSIGDDGLAAEVLESALDFAWRDNRIERLDGDLSLRDIRLAGSDFGSAALQIEADDRDLSARIRLGPGADSFDLRARIDIEDFLGEPAVAAELELAVTAEAPIWRLTPLPPPESGQGRATLKLNGDLPAVLTLDRTSGRLLPWLMGSRLEGEAQIGLTDVTVPGEVSRLSAMVPVELELDGSHLDLTLRLDAGLDTAGLPARWLAELGLPREMLGRRLTAKLDAEDGEPLEIRLTPKKKETVFELNGALALHAADHLALSLAGDLQGAFDRDFTLIDLSADGLALNAEGPKLAGTPITKLSLASLLAVELTNQEGRLEHEISADSSELGFLVRPDGGPPFTLQWAFDKLTLSGRKDPDQGHQGRFLAESGRLAIPEFAVAFEGLSASVPLPAEGPGDEIRFRVATVRDVNQPPNFNPLSLFGQLKPRDKRFDVAAEIRGPEDVGQVNVTGWLDPVEARGDLRAVLAPLVFAPDGTQPSSLSPWLARLDRAKGSVEGDAHIAWSPKGHSSKAAIGTGDLSFELEGIAVDGLRLALRLEDLPSPSSPPAQLLVADKIDIGVPLQNLSVRFQLLKGQTPRLGIEQAEFATLGGRFRLEDTVIDPSQPRQALELQVVELELAELFEAIQIEGLTGRGRIAGVVPITIGPDGIGVPDATLAERSPGQLRFNSPVAAQALQSGGEPVELMLQALEDFHYDTLKLTGEKAADGEVRLGIELEGRNPGVLEGRAFRFNINLTGSLDPLLNALLEGRRLTSDLLDKTWRLRQ